MSSVVIALSASGRFSRTSRTPGLGSSVWMTSLMPASPLVLRDLGQAAVVELPVRPALQRLDVRQVLGHLVARQVGADVGLQVVRGRRVVAGLHQGDDLL